jgi:hypothetical protein
MPAGFAAALLIMVLGVFYLGIFGNGVIEQFSTPASPQIRLK